MVTNGLNQESSAIPHGRRRKFAAVNPLAATERLWDAMVCF